MTRREAFWLVAALLAIHDAEEALAFPRYLPLVLARLQSIPRVTYQQMLAALAVVTLVPVVVVAWAQARPASRAALWAVLLIQTVMLVNVVSHVAVATFLLRGYGPGLATALALNLPWSIYLLRRARREEWLGRGAFVALLPAALVVHGPLLVGLILLSRHVTR